MKDGFVNVAAVTPVVTVADCSANTQAILECIHNAAEANAKIIVLPELCITAYTQSHTKQINWMPLSLSVCLCEQPASSTT